MASTDYTIDALLIDGGLVIGTEVVVHPAMRPPVRRAEQETKPSAGRVDE